VRLASIADLERFRTEAVAARQPRNKEIVVSADSTCCILRGSLAVADALRKEISERDLGEAVGLRLAGCLGFCEIEPMVVILPQKILYQRVKGEDVAEIVERTIQRGEIVERLLYTDPATRQPVPTIDRVPFYQKQMRLVLGPNESIEPTRFEDYVATGGYSALAKVLSSMSPEAVIGEIKRSGLRGRGGAGYPTGRKWESARKAPSPDGVRYVICNADEGDPGAYMDRAVLEANPHSVIEGMIIGSWAVGSHEGYFYVRTEYPLAVEHIRTALRQAEEHGLLGANILGSGHDFTIRVVRGAGAFVCGESSALMASIEGRVGRPRAKYVHATDRGLRERPTNLNNVETWANVPLIINRGADWFSGIGTEGSKGTKIFSLVGKINNTGLVEVPMGITLRDIIFDIGGGVPKGKRFKAVQTGGPSGGCIPESLLDLPVDYEELTKAGSMMGSGGMIVMDEDTCMVDTARYFLNFLKGESCGKCVPCREGIKQALAILERISRGEGREEDIATLEEIGTYQAESSLCALGQSASNPVLSTIRYFRDEYETHIRERSCPAGVCKSLFRYLVDAEKCTGCMACKTACPVNAIEGERKQPHRIRQQLCITCGACYDACRFDAIEKARNAPVAAGGLISGGPPA
jgi:NADH:ubiquinone oxidoreductase subunit F (NADH-binding)/(2Fe-2S) ferredoxin/Pyruvate/2-oxoacid:ferredoxin oxidoreductase delta subunit